MNKDDARSRLLKQKIQEKRKSGKAGSVEIKVEVGDLHDNPYQPRMAYGEEDLKSLSCSIKERGLLQPIVVTQKDGKYIIVAGHRRARACRGAGLSKVPAVVLDNLNDKDLMLIAAAENIVRVNLSLVEEAKSYYDMAKNGIGVKQIAKALGVSETVVSRKKNLLHLSERILDDIRLNNSTKDVTALTLLRKIKDENLQVSLYFDFLKKGREWLKREIENCACAISDQNKKDDKKIQAMAKSVYAKLSRVHLSPGIRNEVERKLREISEMLEKTKEV